MVDRFINHIKSKSLLASDKTYLLACSGGLDSLCLAHLLLHAAIPFEIAHVNFQLRGEESDGDEDFVARWAADHGKLLHVHKADTMGYASQKSISTQMAAREIRYTWFETIRSERNLDGIVLAHHQDDQLETIFLNLLRGTGIEGIYGMAERRGHLIRPLLSFSRKEIFSFATSSAMKWREDSSNEKTEYRRNKLRHEGLPAIYATSEDSRANLLQSFERLKDTGRAFTSLVEMWKTDHIIFSEGMQHLPLYSIIKTPGASSLLYFWLRPYGFNPDQVKAIHQACLTGDSGKLFETPTHLLNLDRTELILAERLETYKPVQLVEESIEIAVGEISYDILRLSGPQLLDKSGQNAMMDLDRLQFPLEIRVWEEGDRFIPLGMKNSKKVSDFLIDLKIPLLKKQAIKVLVSEGQIAWIIGLRISDWAKTTAASQKILYFKKR